MVRLRPIPTRYLFTRIPMPEFQPVTLDEMIDTVYGAIADFVTHSGRVAPDETVNYVIPSIVWTRDDTFFLDGEIPAGEDSETRQQLIQKQAQSAYRFANLVDFVPSVTPQTVLVNDDGVGREADLGPHGHITSFDEYRSQGMRISQAYEEVLRSARVFNRQLSDERRERLEQLRARLEVPEDEEENAAPDPGGSAASEEELSDEDDLDALLAGLDGGGEGSLDDLLPGDDGLFTAGSPPQYTRLMQRYFFFKNAYQNAEDAFLQRLMELENDPSMARLRAKLIARERRRLNQVKQLWQVHGKKDLVEKIMNTIAAMEQGGMVDYRARLQERLGNLEFDVELVGFATDTAYYSELVPANVLKAESWQRIKLTNKSSRNHFKARDTSFSGRARFPLPYGLMMGASGSHSRSTEVTRKGDEEFRIEFEITQALITRPWLDLAFLKSRLWTMSDPETGESLAGLVDGDFLLSDGGQPPEEGVMRAYTTSVILVRDLKLTSRRMADLVDEMEKQTEAKASLRFMGFGLYGGGGKYNKDEVEKLYEFDESTGEFTMMGTHIVAFRGALLPKAPNPNFDEHPDPENWV
jgi:hypothetical protein